MASSRRSATTLTDRSVPTWWLDAKLGIFIHWTIASVPAFAPTSGDYGGLLTSGAADAFKVSPYVEWYENSLRFPDSPAATYHQATYPDRTYRSFVADFEAGLEHWDPVAWAKRFAATGARYVVLVAKHHDGWCLWPTEVENPHRPGWHATRDVVGELACAVRSEGLRFGLYYSGGLDWTFRDTPMGSMGGVIAAIPRGDYPAYARAQVLELIDRYEPDVLWNDIAWPEPKADLFRLFEHYYDTVPNGVVNDRWMPWSPLALLARTGPGRRLIDRQIQRQATADGGLVPPRPPHFDVRTPEYTVFDTIQTTPWECVRGMDHSFGFNAQSTADDFISRDELTWMLTDIAAKGGNLLLNVGPRGIDASIPDLQDERLGWLVEQRDHFEAALEGTRPWGVAGEVTPEGTEVRYTTADGRLFVHARGAHEQVTLSEVSAGPDAVVTTLSGHVLSTSQGAAGLVVMLNDEVHRAEPIVLQIEGTTRRLETPTI